MIWALLQRLSEMGGEPIRNNLTVDTRKDLIFNGVESTGDDAINNDQGLEIPQYIKSIDNGAFSDWTKLESIVTPENITSIGNGAFCDLTELKSIVISEGVKSIGDQAFWDCKSLQLVVVCKGVERIGDLAFWGCESLSSVVISGDVKRIGQKAFRGCKGLNLIVLPDALVKNRVDYGITSDQMVIQYSDFIKDWKRNNGLESQSYSDRAILFLYQLQNIETFNPTWNEFVQHCSELCIGDILNFSGSKLREKLSTIISKYIREDSKGSDLIHDDMMNSLTVGDLVEQSSAVKHSLYN